VHEPPADFADAELAAALREHWGLAAADLRYLPVGFGGYHWSVTDAAGRRWFATATRLATEDEFADLTAAMSTAAALAAQGLDFVLAPVATAGGQVAIRLRADYAVTLYPFAHGTPGRWGDVLTPADRAAVIRMLAALHGSGSGTGLAPVRSPDLPGRGLLDLSLRERGRCWSGGPYAEAARALVTSHEAGLREALAGFGEQTAAIAAAGRPQVITHGEPHPGNLLRNDTGFLLIDWDTVGLAQPERDLWWVVSESGAEAASYAALTGREVSQRAVDLYRLRWDLDDICAYLAEFRGQHQRTRDTEVAWAAFAAAVERVATAAWR
jgi:spectinomycin phosphotransferase